MMRIMKVVAALLLCVAIADADDKSKGTSMSTKPEAAGKMDMARPEATFLNGPDMKWMAAPPELPKGAQVAVLHGDPTRPGTFVMRLKVPDGYKIAPHWHTQDEQLTIIEGTMMLRMGDSAKSEPHALEPGGFHYLPGSMHHSAEFRGPTVVQIDGHGPFDIHYLNPADRPNPQAATR